MSIFSFSNNPIEILDTHDAIGLGSGGSLTVDGGASIAQDVYIGGFIDAPFNAHTIGSLTMSSGTVGIVGSLNVSNSISSTNLIITNATIGSLQPQVLNYITSASGTSFNVGSFIIRSGHSANQTDTILLPSQGLGGVTETFYKNDGSNAINIAGGSGVTLNGITTFSTGSTHKITMIMSSGTSGEAIITP